MPAKAVSEKEVNALKVTELKELLDKNGVKTPAKVRGRAARAGGEAGGRAGGRAGGGKGHAGGRAPDAEREGSCAASSSPDKTHTRQAKKADLQELAIKNIVGGRESDAVASPKRGRPRKVR